MDYSPMILDYTLIMKTPSTRIVSSYFHTPSATDRRLFHAVLRAGHIKTAADYRIERRAYPGHDWLLCIAGSGVVRIGKRVFSMAAGQLGWIDCSRPHAHWPDETDPWELLWLRVDSPNMNLLAGALSVRDNPVFTLSHMADAVTALEETLDLLRERPLTLDASLHAAVSIVVALLFAARQTQSTRRDKPREARANDRLRGVLAQIRLNCRRAWTINDLARLTGMSPSHLFRSFNQVTGASPLDWLRRERINEAKRRLSETGEHIRVIAEQVGYRDPFYFSRDFKKLVGDSPRRYRQQERDRGHS